MPSYYFIYENQERMGEITGPFNYMPQDILYRLPLWMGEPEPSLRYTYPIIRDGERFDPLAIYVGWTEGGKPFAWNPRYIVNPLMLVVGTPGSGKSATLKTIIYNLLRNEVFLEHGERTPPIVVVDPEGEYDVLGNYFGKGMLHLKLGRRDYINIFDRPTKLINPVHWYMRMLTVIQKFLHISPAQAAQAYRVLKQTVLDLSEERGFTSDPGTWTKPDITLKDVYDKVQELRDTLESKPKMKQAERIMYRGALTLLSRLDQWMVPPNDAFSRRSTVVLNRIFDYKLIVLDARGLSKDLFGLFTYWIVYWLYGLMLELGPLPEFGIRVVLVIDEAWALLRKEQRSEEENPLEALARRGRKYGILIIVATQTPEDMDEKMFSLFGTLVTGIVPSQKMVEKLVRSRGMPKRFVEKIHLLQRGMLVWSINWANRSFPMSGVPLLVKTDYPIKNLIEIS